jgi:hypothetical protein
MVGPTGQDETAFKLLDSQLIIGKSLNRKKGRILTEPERIRKVNTASL